MVGSSDMSAASSAHQMSRPWPLRLPSCPELKAGSCRLLLYIAPRSSDEGGASLVICLNRAGYAGTPTP